MDPVPSGEVELVEKLLVDHHQAGRLCLVIQPSPQPVGTESNSNLPWDFAGVNSCDARGSLSGSVTADPRNHTNSHEQESATIS